MKKLFLMLLIAGSTVAVSAQSSQAHLGVTFPGGDFGDAAGTGFNVGYKYYKPLSVQNLSLVFGLDFNYNGVNSDIKDRMTKEMDEDKEAGFIDDYELTFSKYINIPLTVGVNYTYPVNETLHAYGEFALGLNASIMTADETTRKRGSSSSKSEESFSSSFGVGFGLEAGVLVKERYNIGLRYNQLGSHKYKYEHTSIAYDGTKYTSDGKTDSFSLNNVSIVFGIRF
jgi:opacity protein-like surface antigen